VALTLKPLAPQEKGKIRIQNKDELLLDSDFQIQTYIAHTADSTGVAANQENEE